MSPVLHLHIPKTGGSTLRGLLETVYGEGFRRAPNRPAEYGTVDTSGASCISGHFAYGTDWGTGWPVVTMVRDPVDRLLSLYHYLRNPPKEASHLHGWAGSVTFAEFAEADYPWLDNDQTRRLAGMERDEARLVTHADFERAMENVRGIGFVGLTDEFDVAVNRWTELHGWPEVSYRSHYVQPGRLRQSELPLEVIGGVIRRQRFDVALVRSVRIANRRVEA